MAQETGVDPDCHNLAADFLEDEWTRRPRPDNADALIKDLSERIQKAVDGFFEKTYP